jgi:hypothetical protein
MKELLSQRRVSAEIVEFILVIPIFFLLASAILQYSYLQLQAYAVTSQIQDRVYDLNAGYVDGASDKDDYLKNYIVSNSVGIVANNLTVENTSVTYNKYTTGNADTSEEINVSGSSFSKIKEVYRTATITANITYAYNQIVNVPGLSGMTYTTTINRTYVCDRRLWAE